MGIMKRMQEDADAEYDWARGLLCEVGALEECENHPGIYFAGKGDVQKAYQEANMRVNRGEYTLSKGQSPANLSASIKAVYDDNSGVSSCPVCDKNFGPD